MKARRRRVTNSCNRQTDKTYHLRRNPRKSKIFQLECTQNYKDDERSKNRPSPRKPLTPKRLTTFKHLKTLRHLVNRQGSDEQKVSALRMYNQIRSEQAKGVGQLVWAIMGQYPWWPAIVIPEAKFPFTKPDKNSCWVLWFGDHSISKVSHKKILPFAPNFGRFASPSKASKVFRKGMEEILKECAVRVNNKCLLEKINTSHETVLDELCKWANDGFKGEDNKTTDNFLPSAGNPLPTWVVERLEKLQQINKEQVDEESFDEETESDFRIEKPKTDGRLAAVKANKIRIEEVCIVCESDQVVIQHPLFKGGLCDLCKEELMNSLFLFDDDGRNCYCIICGNGGTLFVCDNTDCGKVYCMKCVATLVSEQSIELIRKSRNWKCFHCCDLESQPFGLLERKSDWCHNVIKLYQPDVCHLFNLSSDIPKKPVRVLSLFDGIATGKIVLDALGIETEVYYASEIASDAIMVTNVRHESAVQQIGGIKELTKQKLAKICPIDLVIGGSPCDQFSIVNRWRKGLQGESSLMFIEFARVLNEVKILSRDRHVFWLFENVASMTLEVKNQISYFLGCKPAAWDASYFSPQYRRRFFWGNIPGMYCLQSVNHVYKQQTLDEILMGHRKAKVNMIRTVTTQVNSLMQYKGQELLPIQMGMHDDILWVPELESVFGYSAHYTDVGDLSPARRRRLLGKAWSVPVIKHLLSPLRSFFKLRAEND